MKPFLKILSISICLLSLTACETVEGLKQDISNIKLSDFTPSISKSNDESQFLINGNCPKITIVEELSMLDEFTPGTSAKSSNLISSVKMSESESTCTYNDRSVTVDLKLAFNGKLGTKGRKTSKDKPFFSYPFFVAVTSPSGKILAKEIFAASMTYDAGKNEQVYFETLRQIIPTDSRSKGAGYKVMLGFQLAEKQLNYNRKILDANRMAAEQAEMDRIAAEKAVKAAAKKVQMEQPLKDALKEEEAAMKADAKTVTAPKVTRAGPFDIFKTDAP